MRLLLVLGAALVAAPAALAHAELEPASIDAGTRTTIHLTVPCESETAATVSVTVAAPAGVTLFGTTAWNGLTRGDVRMTFAARADAGGDDALRVTQRYSDGRVVAWGPMLHVRGQENASRDRVIIIAAGLAAALFVLVLRRRRGR